MKATFIAACATLALTLPAESRADILLTPFAGLTFGSSFGDGDASCDSDCPLARRPVFGGAIAIVGASGLGVEADLGFVPDFFEPKDSVIDALGTNNVTTVMGSLMFVAHTLGGVRPYVVGGAGLIRSQVGEFGELFDATQSSLGVNAGAGLFVGSGRFRLRGDLRYFRNVGDADDSLIAQTVQGLSFWRATAGVAIAF